MIIDQTPAIIRICGSATRGGLKRFLGKSRYIIGLESIASPAQQGIVIRKEALTEFFILRSSSALSFLAATCEMPGSIVAGSVAAMPRTIFVVLWYCVEKMP